MRPSLLLLLCAAGICGAQTPRDTTHETNAATSPADSAAPSLTWSAGVAAGQLKFSDGSQESALGATIAAHVWGWLDVSVNPTYAWSQGVAVQVSPTVVRPGRRVSGLTDLPVNIGISYEIPGPWSPSIGLSLGLTLPTGDSATLGSGQTGLGANLGLGLAPSDNLWFNLGAGRSISNGYSAGLASSSTTSLALSTGTTAGPVRIGLSFSGDIGAVPVGFESARSVAAGVALPVGRGMSLNVDGSAGLTTGSPTWAYSIGVGTTASGIVAATVAPYQRLRQAFGAGTGIKTKPRTGKP